MWSRRFERGLVLGPPDRRLLAVCAAAVWIPTLFLALFGALGPWARAAMLGWLIGTALAGLLKRRDRPRRAVWRPGRGWSLDLPSRAGVPARLHPATRVLPAFVALSWVLPDGRRARLLVIRRLVSGETFRRLCVLLRYGRGDG